MGRDPGIHGPMKIVSLINLPEVLASLLLTFLGTDPAIVADGEDLTSKAAAIEAFDALSEAVKGSERYWTAPFVLADLEQKEVYILGEHAGMVPGEPLEFFVISEMSGHEYESLMVSYALPSDINQAMLRIGLTPIGPVNSDEHRFWPRGDRVQARFLFTDADGTVVKRTPSEVCLWKGKPLPELPWVFTSAPTLPAMDGSGEMIFGPDGLSPNSIASTFNLINTVFDLPLQGSKTAVYGEFLLPADWKLGEGKGMVLTLRPAPADTYPPEQNLEVQITPGAAHLSGLEGVKTEDLAEVGSALNARGGEVHYVTFDFGDHLTQAEATARAREIQLLSKHVPSLRIDAPPEGQVFFQSFVPDPRFRVRTNRPSQPLELHLTGKTAEVKELKELWGESRIPEIQETSIPFTSPEEWTAYLEKHPDGPSVLFLYIDPTNTLAEMRKWTQPVLDRFPIVFVYKTQGE